MPALPLHEAGGYVAGAYVVLLAIVLLYVSIMAGRLARIERDLGALDELLGVRPQDGEATARADEPARGTPSEMEPAVRAEARAGSAP